MVVEETRPKRQAIIASLQRPDIPRAAHRGVRSDDGRRDAVEAAVSGSTQSVENPVETPRSTHRKAHRINGLVLFALHDSSVTWGMRFA
jgi:hypothetical protein